MIRPEDILSDDQNTIDLGNGIIARKGTIAAFLKNIELLEGPSLSPEDKESVLSTLQQLAPAVKATGLLRHVTFKNEYIQNMLISDGI